MYLEFGSYYQVNQRSFYRLKSTRTIVCCVYETIAARSGDVLDVKWRILGLQSVHTDAFYLSTTNFAQQVQQQRIIFLKRES